MDEVGPFVLAVFAFAYETVELMGHERRSVNVSTPTVIDVGHPVHNTNGLSINVNLEAVAVVDFVILGIDVNAALAHVNETVGHLKVDGLPALEAFVLDRGIDSILLDEATKQVQYERAKESFIHHPNQKMQANSRLLKFKPCANPRLTLPPQIY
jgi:hypothetical protein